MRALLIHPDRDFELRDKLPSQEQALVQDLQLEPLLDAMAGGDELVLRVSREVLLSSLRGDVETIHYRQEVLTDCLASPGVVKAIYDLSWEAMEAKKEAWHWGGGILSNYPASNLSGSVRLLEALSGILRKLRRIAEENAERFQSRGFSRLFTTLRDELNDDYLHELHEHLSRLRFGSGIPVSAWLGESNEGKDYVLHFRPERRWEWVRRLLGTGTPVFTVRIPDRDEAGARALSDLRDRGLKLVAKAVSQSADHVVGFFEMLRTELAFYVGCLTLHARMANLGIPAAFPKPMPAGERTLRGSGLCDLSLGIGMGKNPVPNELVADGKSICIITGANQGGKTSFLRCVGLAQLMMQAGLFVAASSYVAEVCTGILTHFRREEDVSMKSGKLDEELGRMSAIVDVLSRDALVLFNESFAAT
ncbi:MAG TPA: hypothetical protein VMK12_05285, partial [Anaeromyxobacteraceae bacterium]|nr:hypothetical protein [Anaeromyxobacteraceae bacterium]